MKNLLLLLLLLSYLSFPLILNAQFADFPFNTNYNSSLGGYTATVEGGTPAFITDGADQVLELEGDEYLSLPTAMSSNFSGNGSFEIHIKFKITDEYLVNTYMGQNAAESRRILLANKFTGQPNKGFEILVQEWAGGALLGVNYGDGLTIGGISRAGQLDLLTPVSVGTWYDLLIRVRFDVPNPYAQYILNGTPLVSYFNPDQFDFAVFQAAMSSQQIWLGSDMDGFDFTLDGLPRAKTNIDFLTLHSPIPPGDASVINTVLSTFIDQMNGTITLTAAQETDLLTDFILNWDNSSYATNEATILNYINLFAANFDPIFEYAPSASASPGSFEPKKLLQYVMQQWMLDNLYTPANVANMAGMVFEDHESFPGPVAASATRVNGANFTIDGTYLTDPGFHLNDQERVIRPTGYYVPPGELVTVTVPASAVGQGLKLYVGAHFGDLEETWSEFLRFPRITTNYELNSTSVTFTNPFGGGIYIHVPEGSSFGALNFGVSGAVKSPYLSTKAGFTTSLGDYNTQAANGDVQWVDWESSNFMTTIPVAAANSAVDPLNVLSLWDATFDAVNYTLGRPLARFRSEYITHDAQNNDSGTAMPANNPMPIQRGDFYEPDPIMQPVGIQNPNFYQINDVWEIIMHEMGHLHNMPTLPSEAESNVQLPALAALSIAFNIDIDEALKYSGFQHLTREEAAWDWMLSSPFALNQPMGEDNAYAGTDNFYQHRYQTRSYAKYADIADLFGWEAVHELHKWFYDYKVANPSWNPYTTTIDEFTTAASLATGYDMSPLMHFWGDIPSDAVAEQLANTYPQSKAIHERLTYYRGIIPANNTEYNSTVFPIMHPKVGFPQTIRYEDMQTAYTTATADANTAHINFLICRYFGGFACPNSTRIKAKVLLQGPHNGTDMNTILQTQNLLPVNHPFSGAPFNHKGIECVATADLPDDVVDWILMEVRDPSDNIKVIAMRAGLLRNDGMLLDLDGSEGLAFTDLGVTTGFVTIRHRNHLGVMTSSVVSF